MSSVLIVKGNDGRLEGFGERGARAYGRFLKAVKELEIGELLSFTFKVPRSPKFHKLHFAMLRAVFESQEQFSGEYEFRKWCEVGAGHVKFVPGPQGRMVALPKSIAYDALDDVEFSELHDAVKAFLRTPHALAFLWGHLDESKASESIEAIFAEFERG